MDAPADVHGLLHESAFRRFVVASMALHVGLVGFALYAPRFPSRPRDATMVMVVANLPTAALPKTSPKPPAPPPEPEPTPPPPAEQKAEEPTPEPPPEEPPPPQPEQKVEEPIVIPKEPPPRPHAKVEEPPQAPPEAPKPRPKVAKAEPPKPEPTKAQPKPQSAAELIAAMRAKVGDPGPESPSQTSGGPGIVDPELAAYQQLLLNCFYQKWLGTQQYRRRRDLQVEFEVRVTPEGGVLSIDKVRESGVTQLDLSAERAIQSCAPGGSFPPPPRGHNLLRFTFVPGDKT